VVPSLISTVLVKEAPSFISKTAKWLIHNKKFIACSILGRERDARIAYSAIVRMKTTDNRYILVRNLHRPENFAPFGGIYKYSAQGENFIDKIEFKPHYLGTNDHANSDLRGFTKRKHIGSFNNWRKTGKGREDYADCIHREIKEELNEIGERYSPSRLSLNFIRTVIEGPHYEPSVRYTSLRIFDVYDINHEHFQSHKFVERLANKSKSCDGIKLVTPNEIKTGRTDDGNRVAHHANYFFASESPIPPDTPFPMR
jgi:hypothetical protein